MSIERATSVRNYNQLYVGGRWVAPATDRHIDVIDPASEEVIGRVPACSPEDVDRAVQAARSALIVWAKTPVADRTAAVRRIAEVLLTRVDELATLIQTEVGAPINFAYAMQAAMPSVLMRTMADVATSYPFVEQSDDVVLLREPVGVVGAITPWNFPAQDIGVKVASALSAGCTIVLKPSELAPLNAFLIAEAIDAASLPPGVFNLVAGTGPVVGRAIALHPDIDMISFTGSTEIGRQIAGLAAHTVKRVALQLGGKSACIVLPDAPVERAVNDCLSKCFLNSGQTCTALSRLLVPRSLLREAEEVAIASLQQFTPGHPSSPETVVGPLISAQQRDRVRGYIGIGSSEGARLIAGGTEPPAGLSRGYYVKPTIFSDVDSSMTIARDEIFGPVLAILAYRDERDAVEQANDNPYGLSASVWSADIERAMKVGALLRVGQVEINGGNVAISAPFGGTKQSGHGREMGREGLEEYLAVKAVLLASSGGGRKGGSDGLV